MGNLDISRRQMLVISAGFGLAIPGTGLAQITAGKPIRLVVPFVAGGATDAIGRIVAQRLATVLSTTVIVENRAGANGNIGAESVVRSEPDGHTLLFATAGVFAVNQSLYKDLSFSTVRDLSPISGIYDTGNVLLVRKNLPAANVAELIALAQAQPNKLTFASGGSGSSSHMFGELFKQVAKVQLLHVPYRSNGPALTDLLGGIVDIFFDQIPSGAAQVNAGMVRALAVTTMTRSVALPDVSTFTELGLPALTGTFWVGLAAPAQTPAAVIQTLHAAVRTVLDDPAVKERLLALGAEPLQTSPEEFGKMIAADTERWGLVVRAANLQP